MSHWMRLDFVIIISKISLQIQFCAFQGVPKPTQSRHSASLWDEVLHQTEKAETSPSSGQLKLFS